MKMSEDRPREGGGVPPFGIRSHKYLKQPSLTTVLNRKVEDIAGGVAPIPQHIADLHVIDISCWWDRYR